MNHKRVYKELIERSKNRVLTGYTEKHHIIPKSLGGSDEEVNLVKLTAREHFIAHLLLTEIYPESDALRYAVWAMANLQRNKYQLRNYKVSARLYERLKSHYLKMKENKIEYECSYCKKKVKRQVCHKRSRMFCSRKCYIDAGGVTGGEVHIYKGDQQKFVSKEDAKTYELQGWKRGRKQLTKKVYQLTLDRKLVRSYDSVKEATGEGFSVTGISQCAHGKRKTHKGFIWTYERDNMQETH